MGVGVVGLEPGEWCVAAGAGAAASGFDDECVFLPRGEAAGVEADVDGAAGGGQNLSAERGDTEYC